MNQPLYKTNTWRKLRQTILARDNWTCQIQGNKCTLKATCVDHIQPLHYGGEELNPNNLRAACNTCNVQRVSILKQKYKYLNKVTSGGGVGRSFF